MDTKQTVTEGNGGEGNELREKWNGLSEDERFQLFRNVKSAQQGSDRKAQQLSEEVETLKAQVNESGAAVTETAETVAAIKAREILVSKKADMIARALEGGIDPKIAVQFVHSDSPDELFDSVSAEIHRKAAELSNETLLGNEPDRAMLNPNRLNAREMGRIPERILQKARGLG